MKSPVGMVIGLGNRRARIGLLDLNAKLSDEPAYANIARYFGCTPLPRVPTYAAGGYYYAEDSLGRLESELSSYIDQGFDAFKIKIGGAPLDQDLRPH